MSKLTDTLLLFYHKLDKIKVYYDGGESCACNMSIPPRKFLFFAKTDCEQESEHQYINALTNAKRAIDCQIDCTLDVFGCTKLNKELEPFVYDFVDRRSDTAYKLKVIQALGIAPSKLVSEVRIIRHKLEHEYKAPNKVETLIAIDTAELFLIANESKTSLIETHLHFVNTKRDLYERGVTLIYSVETKEFHIRYTDKKDIESEYVVKNNEVEYYYLVRLVNTIKDQFEARRTLLKLFLRSNPATNTNLVLEVL